MASAYGAQQMATEALATWRRSFALLEQLAAAAPEEPTYRLALGRQHWETAVLYWSLKRPDDAEREFTEAAHQYRLGSPHDPSGASANGLAWVLVDCPAVRLRDPKEAVPCAQEAVARAPDEGDFWNTLGVAHFRNGTHAEAVAAFQKSIELRAGGNPADWFFLAMICWQRGEHNKAREWYKRSIQWIEKNQPVDESLMRYKAEADSLFHTAGK
jgi:tetratricopeptide (TPR) repeat protein